MLVNLQLDSRYQLYGPKGPTHPGVEPLRSRPKMGHFWCSPGKVDSACNLREKIDLSLWIAGFGGNRYKSKIWAKKLKNNRF